MNEQERLDRFAAAALTGLCISKTDPDLTGDDIADMALHRATALMEAIEKATPKAPWHQT